MDVMYAFNAFWSLDAHNFYLVNQAYMVLLRKKKEIVWVAIIDQ
jgi:hypothetical protein